MAAEPTPKDRFTSLDTLALVRELRELLRARVDKAFDLVGGGWSLAFRVPGAGRRELVLLPGRYAALLTEGPEHAEALSPLARELRRLLTGASLRGVADPAGERYLELALGRTDDPEPFLLALEMFGKGNLIVARAGKIAAVAQPRRWAHRQIRVGTEYSRPPTRLDPWTVDVGTLEQELARSRTDLASTLAARLALGGPVAEEVIARADAAGSESASGRSTELAPRLHRALARLVEEVGEHPRGFVYRRESSIVDATPYASQRWSGVPGIEQVERATFSQAAQEFFSTLVVAPPSPEEAEAAGRRRELDRLQEQQLSAIASLTDGIRGLQEMANAIFAHYPEAEEALARARPPAGDARVVEAVLGGRAVPLRVDATPRESARELFEEAKRLQAKLAGAQAALAETEARRSEPEPRARAPRRAAAAGRSGATHWFERFRWFLSSEGAIVVGGRDASSNDRLVRRHLRPADVYVHADLHGAASVIVKHPEASESTVSEVTLREAGQFAVVFSKAWRAGLAAASAFWVSPDQVSKSAAAGEFVARGSWVISGTKHVLRDLPLEVGLGTVDYAGESLWTAAPPAAVRARGRLRAVLVPGEERERESVEIALAQELELSRSRLQSLLPAGGLSVRRT